MSLLLCTICSKPLGMIILTHWMLRLCVTRSNSRRMSSSVSNEMSQAI